MLAGRAVKARCFCHWPTIRRHLPPCQTLCVKTSLKGGAQPLLIRCSMEVIFACQSSPMAMLQSACSPPAVTTLIQRPPTMLLIWCHRITISHSTSGCVSNGRAMQWCISVNMAIWNGCLARRWHCHPPAILRRFWGRCRISTPLSSMIPERVRRPNAVPQL